jgi:hypothetical protein
MKAEQKKNSIKGGQGSALQQRLPYQLSWGNAGGGDQLGSKNNDQWDVFGCKHENESKGDHTLNVNFCLVHL